jgi:hypothetical protein
MGACDDATAHDAGGGGVFQFVSWCLGNICSINFSNYICKLRFKIVHQSYLCSLPLQTVAFIIFKNQWLCWRRLIYEILFFYLVFTWCLLRVYWVFTWCLLAVYLPFYLVFTWCLLVYAEFRNSLRGLHLGCTWVALGLHLGCTISRWVALGLHLGCTWVAHFLSGLHLGCTWVALGLHTLLVGCTWVSLGLHLGCTWFAHGLHMVCSLSTHCLLTVYSLPTHCFTHCLLTVYSLSTHCVLTVYSVDNVFKLVFSNLLLNMKNHFANTEIFNNSYCKLILIGKW